MKKYVLEFVHRGFFGVAFGPVVLAIVYGILGATGAVESLTTGEVCSGIISVTLMAFIAAGINMIYTVECLPLISAILIHAGVLYVDYLIMYLFNSWMPRNLNAIAVFTGIFAVGFAAVWVIIYLVSKKDIDRLNSRLENHE